MNKDKKPVVLVIDDDELICKAVSWSLETIGYSCQIYHDGHSFLEAYNREWRGCCIIDVRMPGMSGLELQQELNKRLNHLPIIMISGHGDVPMAVRAMQAGARDFILKPFNEQILLEKVQAAVESNLKNEIVYNVPLAVQYYQTLTPREKEVMKLVTDGNLNKQIAAKLNISLSTVELHRAKVMQKMYVKSLAELIKISISIAAY